MLEIDSQKLRDYIDEHKSLIGINIFNSICEIISGVGLAITIITTTISIIFEILAGILALIVSVVGMYQLYVALHFDGRYKPERVYKEICELDEKNVNIYDIILFQNPNKSGKYLLYKNVNWKCNLFLNYRFLENTSDYAPSKEVTRLIPLLENTLGINGSELKLQYIGKLTNTKYCVTEKYNKKYDFHFYKLNSQVTSYYNNVDKFEYNGKHFAWMTLDEMYSDKTIRKRNCDVLDFVRDSGENIA